MSRRAAGFRNGVAVLAAVALFGCGSGGGGGASQADATPTPTVPTTPTRSWEMGFATNPPRPTAAALIGAVEQWSRRAELAAIHEDVPWRELLGGTPADTILQDKVQLVAYLRGKGLKLYYMADATDGLSRAEEASALRALGRSLTEPAVQQVYRAWVLAVARKLNPDILGLAAETNLVRAAAPPALYAALVRTANDAAADLRAAGVSATLLHSVQVETAWGVLAASGPYVGVERDFADFPFSQWLGLSSYPYFGYAQPEDIPADYYRRLLGNRTLPVMVVEGGWTSASVGTVRSSPELQARYITRQAGLLDSVGARGLVQLVYADIDTASFPQPQPGNLPLFVRIGLTDSDLEAKPALAAWDALHARRRVSP